MTITNTSAYGFEKNQIVLNKVNLLDENERLVNRGTKLRVVAIASKVRPTNSWLIKEKPEYWDNKLYFVNLVRADQEDDYTDRIRCNFVCIEKIH